MIHDQFILMLTTCIVFNLKYKEMAVLPIRMAKSITFRALDIRQREIENKLKIRVS